MCGMLQGDIWYFQNIFVIIMYDERQFFIFIWIYIYIHTQPKAQ